MNYITLSSAAKIAGCHLETVRRWILTGAKFRREPLGKTWLVDEATFRHWLETERADFTNPRRKNVRKNASIRKSTQGKTLAKMTHYVYLQAGKSQGTVMERKINGKK